MKMSIKGIWSISLILLLNSCVGTSDHIEDLGNGYQAVHEGPGANVISYKEHIRGDKFIPCDVVAYDFSDEFIVAKQRPTESCFWGDDTNTYGKDSSYYWIISHKQKLFLGPLGVQDYLLKRQEFSIPEEVSIEL